MSSKSMWAQIDQLVKDIQRFEQLISATTFSLDHAKEELQRLQETMKSVYRAGDRFKKDEGHFGEPYILATLGVGQVNLISLQDGNRWSEPLQVSNAREINRAEFEQHFGTEWRRVHISGQVS